MAPEVDGMATRALEPKRSAFAARKLGDSLPPLPRPPHRKPSKSIAPTPIDPSFPSVIPAATGIGQVLGVELAQPGPLIQLSNQQ